MLNTGVSPKRYCWGPRFQEVGEEVDLYPMLYCHHQNDSCIKMGTDESLFWTDVITCEGQSHKIVSHEPQLSKREENRSGTELT